MHTKSINMNDWSIADGLIEGPYWKNKDQEIKNHIVEEMQLIIEIICMTCDPKELVKIQKQIEFLTKMEETSYCDEDDEIGNWQGYSKFLLLILEKINLYIGYNTPISNEYLIENGYCDETINQSIHEERARYELRRLKRQKEIEQQK